MESRRWTNLQLTIVYYIVKHGAHGCIKNNETGKFLTELEIVTEVGHGMKSYIYCKGRFSQMLGYDVDQYVYRGTPTNRQKSIVAQYQNFTVSEMRIVISDLINELYSKINDNILQKEEKPLEVTKETPSVQYRLDL